MPTFANRIQCLTFNLPDDGALLSTNSVPLMVSTPTNIVTSPGALTLQDVPDVVIQHNSGNVQFMSYTAVAINVDQQVANAAGHEPGYLVDIQGTTATKQIKLKDNLGNVGDLIVKTASGPEWAPEYYSTIYNLEDASPITGTEDEGGNFAVMLDPRNGFTQYLELLGGNGGIASRIMLPTGLPTGRRWAVRFELNDPNGYFFWGLIDPSSTVQVDWLKGMNDLANPDIGINLYEFYTRNGGNTWIACKYHGGSFD